MHYNIKNIFNSTALALLLSLSASTFVYAQTVNSEKNLLSNNNDIPENSLNFDINLDADSPLNEASKNARSSIPLDNNSLPLDKSTAENNTLSVATDNTNLPLLESSPVENKAPLDVKTDSNPLIPSAENNAPLISASSNTSEIDMSNNPLLVPSSDVLLPANNSDNPVLLPEQNKQEEIPDLINIESSENPAALGDDILNKIDNNLFSKMSSIEKQSALLTLELRREKIRSEIEAIKAQRKKAQEEEEARAEERRQKRIEWENEQQRKLLVEQQKLQELENQRELLRQEKIVKAYKEVMLTEKQEWIKNNAKLYDQISQIEAERDATISDFKMKLSNLKTMSSKAVSSAQAARDRYNQAVNSLRSQLSVVQSRLDAELKAKLAKNNPFAVAQDAVQVKLNDVYAIMEIVGKGENLAAKLMNKNGDRFLVRKGTVLQTGHIIDEITETYIRGDIDGVKDYLFFAAGGILDSEPQKSNVLKGIKASMAASKEGGSGNSTQNLNTSSIPSLGEGMFVR